MVSRVAKYFLLQSMTAGDPRQATALPRDEGRDRSRGDAPLCRPPARMRWQRHTEGLGGISHRGRRGLRPDVAGATFLSASAYPHAGNLAVLPCLERIGKSRDLPVERPFDRCRWPLEVVAC